MRVNRFDDVWFRSVPKGYCTDAGCRLDISLATLNDTSIRLAVITPARTARPIVILMSDLRRVLADVEQRPDKPVKLFSVDVQDQTVAGHRVTMHLA